MEDFEHNFRFSVSVEEFCMLADVTGIMLDPTDRLVRNGTSGLSIYRVVGENEPRYMGYLDLGAGTLELS